MYPNHDLQPRRAATPKKPAAPKGHEAFLKTLETAGAVVSFGMVSDPDSVIKGTIRASDKYTVSVKVDRADGSHQVYVLFKHAIESFWTDPADQPKKEV